MAQCPRCKGDMPLLSKICPTCGYTIDNSETTLTPMEYMESLEGLLKELRSVNMPTFLDSFKKLLALVMLLLTIYFFVMSFMTGAFIFKLFCNISLIILGFSLALFILKKVKCNKEYIVFLCSPEASKSRKDNKFLSKDDISEFCNEITENSAGNVPVQSI